MVQRAVFSDNKKIMQSIGTSIWGTLQPLPPLKLIPCRGFNPDTSDSDVIYKIDTDISNSYIENVSIHVKRALDTLLKGSDIYTNKNFKNYIRIQEKYSEVLEYSSNTNIKIILDKYHTDTSQQLMELVYINSDDEEEQETILNADNLIDLDKLTLIKFTLEHPEIYVPVNGVLKEIKEVIKKEQKSKTATIRKKFETQTASDPSNNSQVTISRTITEVVRITEEERKHMLEKIEKAKKITTVVSDFLTTNSVGAHNNRVYILERQNYFLSSNIVGRRLTELFIDSIIRDSKTTLEQYGTELIIAKDNEVLFLVKKGTKNKTKSIESLLNHKATEYTEKWHEEENVVYEEYSEKRAYNKFQATTLNNKNAIEFDNTIIVVGKRNFHKVGLTEIPEFKKVTMTQLKERTDQNLWL
ncbi:unnamed protein product [Hermetia illucens]|uniref:Uncharacterized protein n=1 Tax=Hermetia illucens TaxID=343691 RepID=A0A7R8UCX7_HERIL|nr:unnamed protein product [Hermetia illucens]